MKPIRTPACNVTLTLPGGTEDNELPAQRAMIYDTSIGETQDEARLGFVTQWMPTEDEARRLEAGAAIELAITSPKHPPVSLTVTDAVLPWAELVQRGRVERALGKLYADLAERAESALEHGTHDVLPDAATFADLWREALDATADDHARGERARQIIDPRRNGRDT